MTLKTNQQEGLQTLTTKMAESKNQKDMAANLTVTSSSDLVSVLENYE